MFDHTSRYYHLDNSIYRAPDGSEITYKQRRFLPQGDKMPLLVAVTVGPSDRLDGIAARHLGDPLQFWQICDANNATDPFELVAEVGKTIRGPLPQFQEG